MSGQTKIITIKREIHTNDNSLIEFLEDSMRYRRYVYNKGVEYITKNNGKFDRYEFGTYFYNNYELTDPLYNWYARGIRATVARELKQAVTMVKIAHDKGNENAALRFHSYNPHDGSFKVENKSRYMCAVVDNSTVEYNASAVKCKEGYRYHFNIHTKEPIHTYIDMDGYMYDKHKRYKFHNDDIKEVGFVKKVNKYYIIIVCEVTFIPRDTSRKPLCGMDLGIHNPITLYDGNKIRKYRFNPRILRKLAQLEERTKRLQSIMDRKMTRNKELGIETYSKNYEKVRYKFRKTWEKIYNIRKDWRFKLAYELVNTYEILIVDEFTQPVNLNTSAYTKINHFNRLHGMCIFTLTLQYMAVKYDCAYVTSPPDTTRTCSYCGHVNPKLSLSKRNLECEECGRVIDRDDNAAINCYESFIYV